MEIEIRPATIRDIDAIGEIIQLAFDDKIDKRRVQYLIIVSPNYIYVAVQAGKVVGFVENFVTISQSNQIRLELDLLAVHPDARGRGIGKQLIAISMQKAEQLGVDYLRVLIASNNTAMQKACQQMGLQQSDILHALYVRSHQPSRRELTETSDSHLLWIANLTYSGVWLEGAISQQTINNADSVLYFYHGDILGAVVDKTQTRTVNLLLGNQFSYTKDFHRWFFNPKVD